MGPTIPALIAYYRVSTRRQGKSGLGLEAQAHAFEGYRESVGGRKIAEYVEVETGTNKRERPELSKAIAHAKRSGATLVIAKLDRLARNVHVVSGLMESGVEFVAADMPMANRLTLHIMAAMAEYEGKIISQRTKDALAAAKRRGVKLGSARPGHWEGKEDRREAGRKRAVKRAAEVHQQRARAAYTDLLPTIREMHEAGHSLQAIADHLNEQGHTTRKGKPWNRVQVSRVLAMSA